MSFHAQKFSTLFLSPAHADVTIVADRDRFPAHLNIISLHTPYFQEHLISRPRELDSTVMTPASSTCGTSVCGGESEPVSKTCEWDKKMKEDRIPTMLDVNPEVPLDDRYSADVRCMLEWCYKGTYSLKEHDEDRPSYTEKLSTDSSDSDAIPEEDLARHVKIYYLAEHLNLPDLKSLALEKFKACTMSDSSQLKETVRDYQFEAFSKSDPMVKAVVEKLAKIIWDMNGKWKDDWGLFQYYGLIGGLVVQELMQMKAKMSERRGAWPLVWSFGGKK